MAVHIHCKGYAGISGNLKNGLEDWKIGLEGITMSIEKRVERLEGISLKSTVVTEVIVCTDRERPTHQEIEKIR